MNYYPEREVLFDAIRALDFSDIVQRLGLTPDHGGRITCPNPDHADTHPSCKVYPDHAFCFSCGRWFDAVELWHTVRGTESRYKAAQEIADEYCIQYDSKPTKRRQKAQKATRTDTIADAKKWHVSAFRSLTEERNRLEKSLAECSETTAPEIVQEAVKRLTFCRNWLDDLQAPSDADLMEIYTSRETLGLPDPEPEPELIEPEADNASKDFSNVEWNGNTLNAENFKKYLAFKGIGIKFNAISGRIEYKGIEGIEAGHLDNSFPLLAYDDLHRHLTRVNEKLCAHYTALVAAMNEYNPIIELLKNVKWDGKDRLTELYRVLNLQENDYLSRVFLKKWLMQGLAMQHNTLDSPISPEFVLVLHGSQGIGKTTFFRKIAIYSRFFKEGHALNPNDRDSKAEACSYFVTELGEVARTIKKDPDSLKAFLTAAIDEWRRPFAIAAERQPRHTNFCATTNDEYFLADQTGNRRWGVIQVETIDIDYLLHKFNEFEALQLWAQVEELVKDACSHGETIASCFRLTPSEREAQERINRRLLKAVDAELEIKDIFAQAEMHPDEYKYTEITISGFKSWYGSLERYSVEKLRKALIAAGATPPEKRRKIAGKLERLWTLPIPKY